METIRLRRDHPASDGDPASDGVAFAAASLRVYLGLRRGLIDEKFANAMGE
jgi:hypothetical protein